MAIRSAVLLFSGSPEDLGWENFFPVPGLQEEVSLLQSAIVADFAERLSEQFFKKVVIFETSDARVEVSPPSGKGRTNHAVPRTHAEANPAGGQRDHRQRGCVFRGGVPREKPPVSCSPSLSPESSSWARRMT